MKLKYLILSFSLISFFICCNKTTEPVVENIDPIEEIIPLPDSIIDKANIFLISFVGDQFFNSYISYDSTSSKFWPPNSFCIRNPESCAEFLLYPHYFIVYKLKMPHLSFVNEYIEFVLDSVGNLIEERESMGIPQCPSNICWNYFPVIDSLQAVQIAQNARLEAGIRDWFYSFHYYGGDIKDYVWNIKNTTYEEYKDSKLIKVSGKSIIIHARTGEVIKISSWAWFY